MSPEKHELFHKMVKLQRLCFALRKLECASGGEEEAGYKYKADKVWQQYTELWEEYIR